MERAIERTPLLGNLIGSGQRDEEGQADGGDHVNILGIYHWKLSHLSMS